MDTIEQQVTLDKRLNAQRDIIRQSLDAIANDIGMAMRDAGLTFPIYFAMPNSGDAVVTIATTLDPSDDDWREAAAIVCQIIQEKIGCGRLQGRELACAVANAGMIIATDVTAE
jgi:hypothetical protein